MACSSGRAKVAAERVALPPGVQRCMTAGNVRILCASSRSQDSVATRISQGPSRHGAPASRGSCCLGPPAAQGNLRVCVQKDRELLPCGLGASRRSRHSGGSGYCWPPWTQGCATESRGAALPRRERSNFRRGQGHPHPRSLEKSHGVPASRARKYRLRDHRESRKQNTYQTDIPRNKPNKKDHRESGRFQTTAPHGAGGSRERLRSKKRRPGGRRPGPAPLPGNGICSAQLLA